MAISDKLTKLAQTKSAIKTAIETKGVTVGGIPFGQYPAKIEAIEGGGGNYQSKSVTYTSSGTDTVTPDAGYDALSEVSVTVDVSGGGGVETCTLTIYTTVEPGYYDSWVFATTPDGAQEYNAAGTYTILKNSVIGVYYKNYIEGSYQNLLPNTYGYVGVYKATGNLTIDLKKGL